MTALRGCSIGDDRVCLGRPEGDRDACIYCLRQRARDAFRRGDLTFEAFRAVMAETGEGMVS